MVRVMAALAIPIPPFVLRRRLVVRSAPGARGRAGVLVCGEDVDGTPVSFLRSVRCLDSRRVVRSEPFRISFRGDLEAGAEVRLELEFMGNYGEPNLEIMYQYPGQDGEDAVYGLEYHHVTGEWNVVV